MKAGVLFVHVASAQSVLPKKGFFGRNRQRRWARSLSLRPSYGRSGLVSDEADNDAGAAVLAIAIEIVHPES